MVYRNLEVAEERRESETANKPDVTEGGVLGAVGGAVVGALAGGPVGAVVGAILGGVASATAVEAVDQHTHDAEAIDQHDHDAAAPDTLPVSATDTLPVSELETLDQIPRIRERAYFLYEQRGRGDGLDVQDWLIAEREITPF